MANIYSIAVQAEHKNMDVIFPLTYKYFMRIMQKKKEFYIQENIPFPVSIILLSCICMYMYFVCLINVLS